MSLRNSPLNSLDRHFKIGQRSVVSNLSVGQDKGSEADTSIRLSVFGKDDLVEMSGNGDIGRLSDDLIADSPFPICLSLWKIQRTSDNADRRVVVGESTAEVLKVRPVVSVEAFANLGTHITQSKSIIHGFLRPLCVGGGYLVTSIISTSEVVLQLCAELFRYARVLDKD